ncbi:hypothetical protein DEF23_09905 [Marinitenerispora sediminis]|nr:hypothetical protein DEF23_09905 [Marinitenerispora sediminis]
MAVLGGAVVLLFAAVLVRDREEPSSGRGPRGTGAVRPASKRRTSRVLSTSSAGVALLYGLISNIPLIVLAVAGFLLLPRLAPERRGLTATAMALLLVFALARTGLFFVPYLWLEGLPSTLVGILLSLLMGAAFALLIVAACRKPAARRHTPAPPRPAPGPPYGGYPTTPPPTAG